MLSTFVSVSKENKIDRENIISFIIMYVFIIYSIFLVSLFLFIECIKSRSTLRTSRLQ